MSAYYNEIEPFAAEWLRSLIAAGHIAPGDVDERSIEDVSPDDLRGYKQCHFFAGIGVWSHALRLAGWDDDREVWTGSCPCQPFSAAGKGKGFTDERHLWPAWHHLIAERKPSVVFGEQVASKDGLGWLDLVQADMEGTGYAFGAADLCAAGVGAPHIRQRLWFVGVVDANNNKGSQGHGRSVEQHVPAGREDAERHGAASSVYGGLADALRSGARNGPRESLGAQTAAHGRDRGLPGERLRSGVEGTFCGLADAADAGCERRRPGEASDGRDAPREQPERLCDAGRPRPTNGFWRDADWLFCRDGKWRPVEPGTFPLAHGAPARVGRLRAYGNAISPWAAKVFIEAAASHIDARRLRVAGGVFA